MGGAGGGVSGARSKVVLGRASRGLVLGAGFAGGDANPFARFTAPQARRELNRAEGTAENYLADRTDSATRFSIISCCPDRTVGSPTFSTYFSQSPSVASPANTFIPMSPPQPA